MTKSFKYSEIFGNTFQGEGRYAGHPTVWVRFWGCNFSCAGFGQDNPLDPSTWVLEYQDIDPTKYTKMEDLPVFSHGCDSSYSWAKKFGHLAHQGTAEEIVEKLIDLLPGKAWLHPVSQQYHHLALTGGEPLMSQTAIGEIIGEFQRINKVPKFITIETNGTQDLRQTFTGPMTEIISEGTELFWSVSPKLYLSGEHWDQAIKPEVVARFNALSHEGQLKFVVDGSDRAWDEVQKATELYRNEGIHWPVWIMPVGADIEGQNKVAAKVSEGAISRGYNVAARVHVNVFGNVIGK